MSWNSQQQHHPIMYSEEAPLVPTSSTPREDRASVPVMWVLKGVACLMALDFMVCCITLVVTHPYHHTPLTCRIVFLTVQQYWLSTGGNPDLYGVVFSSYSIAQFLFILLVANYLDKHPMRNLLFVTVFINMVGNIVYMSAASASVSSTAQVLIFVGRFVAGIGAANVVVGPYYIVTHTKDMAQRAARIAVYNLYGFIGRVAGPILAFVILEYEPTIKSKHFVMNQFTWPPMITSIDCILVIIMIALLLTPSRDPAPPAGARKSLQGARGLKRDFGFLYAFHTLVLVVFWAWYANIVTIAAVQFHLATRYGESVYWHAYIPILVGFVVGTYLFKFLMRLKTNPSFTLVLALILMIVGFLVLIDNHAQGKWEEIRYWVGCMLLTIGFNIENAAIPAIYSNIIDATENEHIMARLLGVLTLFTCIGRSIGPLWTPLLLKVEPTINDSCCSYINGIVSGPGADNTCCELRGMNVLVLILCVACAVGTLAVFGIINIQKKYVKHKELTTLVN